MIYNATCLNIKCLEVYYNLIICFDNPHGKSPLFSMMEVIRINLAVRITYFGNPVGEIITDSR